MLRKALAQALQPPRRPDPPRHADQDVEEDGSDAEPSRRRRSEMASPGPSRASAPSSPTRKSRLKALLQLDHLLRPSPIVPMQLRDLGGRMPDPRDARRVVSAPEASDQPRRGMPARRRAKSEAVSGAADWWPRPEAEPTPSLSDSMTEKTLVDDDDFVRSRRTRRRRSFAPSPRRPSPAPCLATDVATPIRAQRYRSPLRPSTIPSSPVIQPPVVAWTDSDDDASPSPRARTSGRRAARPAPNAAPVDGRPSPSSGRLTRVDAAVQTSPSSDTVAEPYERRMNTAAADKATATLPVRDDSTRRRRSSWTPKTAEQHKPLKERPSVRDRRGVTAVGPLRTEGLRPMARTTKHGVVELVEGQDARSSSGRLEVRLWAAKAVCRGPEVGHLSQVVVVQPHGEVGGPSSAG